MSLPTQTTLLAVLLLAAAGAAMAQPTAGTPVERRPSVPASAASAAPASAAAGPTGALSYRSAFDGYRPFNDQPIVPWREANDLVARIGGWQAYLREGQREPAAAGGHSGHHAP
jgi:hypothetical protein